MSLRTLGTAVCFTLVSITASAWALAAGNGSSGTGNGIVTIGDGVATLLPDAQGVTRKGDFLVDSGTGEKLIRIESVRKKDLDPTKPELVPAHLGQMKGYEFLPDLRNISTQDNFWIVCGKKDLCLRLVPVSRTNPKVQDIVGGLRSGTQ